MMCYSCSGLPQEDCKRCVIPARDSLKGITNDVLFLLGTPSRGLQTMCYCCSGLPPVDYKRCVIPARDSLKGITNDVLFLIETPSRGLHFVLAELNLSRNNLLYVIHLSYKSSIQIIIYRFNGTRFVIYQTIISNFS